MGEIGIARDGECLQALLGSCLGLVLYDRRRRLGGLAHILLPESTGELHQPGKYVDTAVPFLLDEIKRLGVGQLKLEAKLIGAASMFATTASPRQIGQQNVAACERILGQLQIPIVARHCGGNQGRRITFNSGTGAVRIEMVGRKRIEL